MNAQATEQAENFAGIKKLLDRFVKNVIHFMRRTDTEMQQLEYKVRLDLQAQAKDTDTKIKGSENKLRGENQKMQNVMDNNETEVNNVLDQIRKKLDKVDDTKDVMDQVDAVVHNTAEKIQKKIQELSVDTNFKINRIETEELTLDGLFGP